jgi:hypothetical protein
MEDSYPPEPAPNPPTFLASIGPFVGDSSGRYDVAAPGSGQGRARHRAASQLELAGHAEQRGFTPRRGDELHRQR